MKKIYILAVTVLILMNVGFVVSAKQIKDDLVYNSHTQVATTTAPAEESDGEAVTVEEALPKTENLTFVKSLRGAVSLSWDKVEGAYAYRVFMKTEKDDTFKYCLTVKATNVTIENIENEGGLEFRVRAFAYKGGKAILGDFSDKVGAVTAPADVENIYTRSITDNSITLYWNKAKGATGYRIYIFDEEKGDFKIYGRTPRTTITVSGLKKDRTYIFKILSYKKADGSTAFGNFSGEHEETTYNSGSVPHTRAQAAQYYNNHIAKLKSQQAMKVKYKKSIDTEFVSCSKDNLEVSVKNTVNLFEGTLSKTYNFVGGTAEGKSVNKLVEPYGKKAELERNDIKEYSVQKKDESVILNIVLKSENKIYVKGEKNQKSYFDGVLSLPNYKSLKTSPLVIESADSYYSSGTLTLKIENRKITLFKVSAAVLSNISFSVSDVKASTIVGYGLSEQYKVTY